MKWKEIGNWEGEKVEKKEIIVFLKEKEIEECNLRDIGKREEKNIEVLEEERNVIERKEMEKIRIIRGIEVNEMIEIEGIGERIDLRKNEKIEIMDEKKKIWGWIVKEGSKYIMIVLNIEKNEDRIEVEEEERKSVGKDGEEIEESGEEKKIVGSIGMEGKIEIVEIIERKSREVGKMKINGEKKEILGKKDS